MSAAKDREDRRSGQAQGMCVDLRGQQACIPRSSSAVTCWILMPPLHQLRHVLSPSLVSAACLELISLPAPSTKNSPPSPSLTTFIRTQTPHYSQPNITRTMHWLNFVQLLATLASFVIVAALPSSTSVSLAG